jgi:hypothetical protein
MNKLSDFIPLIVILVSLVISVIGKKKNRDNRGQETMLPGKKPGEVIDKGEKPQSLADSYRKIVEDRPKKQIIQSGIKEEIMSFSTGNTVLESEEEDYSPFTFEEDDLSKAIIYAEIINRKEW